MKAEEQGRGGGEGGENEEKVKKKEEREEMLKTTVFNGRQALRVLTSELIALHPPSPPPF